MHQHDLSWFQRGSKTSKSPPLKEKAQNPPNYNFLFARFFDAEHQQLSQTMLVMLLWSLNWDLKQNPHQWDATQDEVGAQQSWGSDLPVVPQIKQEWAFWEKHVV